MAVDGPAHMPDSLPTVHEQPDQSNTTSHFTAVNGHNGHGSPAVSNQSTLVNGHGNNRSTSSSPKAVDVRSKPDLIRSASVHAREVPDRPPTMNGHPARTDGPPTSSHGQSPHTRKRSFPEAFSDPAALPTRAHGPLAQRSGDAQPSPARYDRYDQAADVDYEPRRPLGSDYDPHAQPAQQPYFVQPAHDDPDPRVTDAFRRERVDAARQARELYATPDEYDRASQPSEYGSSRANAAITEAERKRRKRVFSNRTKTGCMTCRKRKKKCDEAHPECNNCLRGGFVCEGYAARGPWQKPTPTKTPIPLQSKNGYVGSDSQPSPLPRPDAGPDYGGSTPMETGSGRAAGSEFTPISVDDEPRDHPSHGGSPAGDHRAPAGWPKPSPSYAHHASHPAKPHDADRSLSSVVGRHLPPEMAEHESLYPSPTAYPGSSTSGSGHPLPPVLHPIGPGPHGTPALAQAALDTAMVPPRGTKLSELTEREKMLRGEYYLPYTPVLMQDREQCAAAVWRFNNSTNPTNGNSPEERLRFFKAILSLRPTSESYPRPGDGPETDLAALPAGSVGPHVVVEAPFHCDYGYNITIGSNVVIGADCRITDTCTVTIGNNVVFSPGVKLVCATYGINPRERKAGKGRALGRSIVIEDDTWIGSNATILPGVRVGRASTVAAGGVICRDVPPYTVVAGNPQKVVRGVSDDF